MVARRAEMRDSLTDCTAEVNRAPTENCEFKHLARQVSRPIR
jgi:hypothetical protein